MSEDGTASALPATDGPAISVLLVEDDPVQRMEAADLLREAGLAVVEAGTVDAAVTELDRITNLRVLITDVDLTGESLNGFTLAKAVAARWPQIGILIVSGVTTPISGQLPPASRFLRKPYEPHELTAAVFSIVEQRADGTDATSLGGEA